MLRYVGRGENYWSWVHVDDGEQLYVRAMTQAAPGTLLHVAHGEPTRLKDVAEASARQLGLRT